MTFSKVIVSLESAADAVTVAPAAEILPLQKKTHFLSLLKKEQLLDQMRYIDAKIEETKAMDKCYRDRWVLLSEASGDAVEALGAVAEYAYVDDELVTYGRLVTCSWFEDRTSDIH